MSTDGAAIAPISTGSTKTKVKFLCSHGGKILPRPADGHLKYVGGETRVISVPRDIPFHELVKKLTCQIDGEMILKYQVVSEDLDALISVKSDEDLRHMLDEIHRYENAGVPRLRTFLFPMIPVVMENQIGSDALEQRYIDAINGIVRLTLRQHPTINAMQHDSFVSSSCSSPRSPDSCTTEAINNEMMQQGINYYTTRMSMHKVQSSPSICSMNVQQQCQYVHLYPKLPMDLQKSGVVSGRSFSRADGVRYQPDPVPTHYYTSRQNRGNGCCSKCTHYDDCSTFSDRRMMDNGSMTLICSNPRLGQWAEISEHGRLGV